MRQRNFVRSTRRGKARSFGSVESQYLVGSSSPSGHSINSHSSGLITEAVAGAPVHGPFRCHIGFGRARGGRWTCHAFSPKVTVFAASPWFPTGDNRSFLLQFQFFGHTALVPATPRHRTSNALLANVLMVPRGAPPAIATPRSVGTRACPNSRTTTGEGKVRVWTPYRISPPSVRAAWARRLAVAPRRYPPRMPPA